MRGNSTLRRYWNPAWARERPRPIDEDAEELRATLDEAAREQMVADVPLGAFLSGGIDSTIVTGLMQRSSNRPVQTFAIGFPDPAFDETAYAETAARFLGTEHRTFRVEPHAWEDLPALADQFDEPFADSSALPTWYVSRETRRHVTVALTGDAGDELFGGYDRYRALAIAAELERKVPASARRLIGGPVARALPASSRAKTRMRAARRLMEGLAKPFETRYLGWIQLFGEEARASLYDDAWLSGLPGEDPADCLSRALGVAPLRDPSTRAMIADLLTYLPGDLLVKVDLASMAHSLECRAPFLDHRVVELALAMPVDRKVRLRPGRSKAVLKRAFSDLLPPAIRTRRKMGFGVPIDRWFRGELLDPLRSVLLDPVCLGRGIFQPSAVKTMIDQHAAGTHDHAYRLWALLMLELWFRHHLERPPARVPASTSVGLGAEP
ncbi:MAG: asparagine synthase-related protein [Isosphaeraceae bacterium]